MGRWRLQRVNEICKEKRGVTPETSNGKMEALVRSA